MTIKKDNQQRLQRQIKLVEGFIGDDPLVSFWAKDGDLYLDLLNLPYTGDYRERVLDDYIAYIRKDYERRCTEPEQDGKKPKRWQPPRLRDYVSTRRPGRKRGELLDQVYYEAAIWHYKKGLSRKELVKRFRASQYKEVQSNPSQHVERALKRYDNKTLKETPQRDLILLENNEND